MTITQTAPLDFACREDASAGEIAALEDALDTHNIRLTGIDDCRLLSILLRDADGRLYAGLHGQSWGGTCQLKLLWVAEDRRGQGLGTRMLAEAEAEARRRGCHQIMLATHSFQAPRLYERHGFQRIAVLADNPIGHSDILMLKRLTADQKLTE